jgi:hypothetical protein
VADHRWHAPLGGARRPRSLATRSGDVILVPAGSSFGVDNLTDEPAIAWVTTSAGFMGVMPDGSWITPPWTR